VSPFRTIRAGAAALAVGLVAGPAVLAVGLIAAPVAHASASYGPAMSAAQVRSIQAEGVREIIVKRQPDLSAAGQAALRAQAGITYEGPGPLPNTELDQAPAGDLAGAVATLKRDPAVQYAEPNGEVSAASTPNDPYFGLQWALSNTGQSVLGTSGTPGDDIGATYAWTHASGASVTVAVVDTGVDLTAADLAGRLVPGQDYVSPSNAAQDQNGHGTHVAGIIAADQNNFTGVSGVAPAAEVMPLRVLDSNGSGTLDAVAAAFNYAGQHNVRIVNASLGGPGTSQALADAITSNPNTLYVVAAGNDGANDDDPSSPFYPCDIPAANLICVGASDQNDQPASFSDYGATSVDLFAPGVNILSTYLTGSPPYAYLSGTSMATPMVSGTLALMLSHNPSLSAAQLKSDLLASADPAPQLSGLSVTGGELDAAAAVAMAGGDAPYAAPGDRGVPTVTGNAAVGGTLSTSQGSWSRRPTSYAYQWRRCVQGTCVPIPGATSATYSLTGGDAGTTVDVIVTASNAVGSTQVATAATSEVTLADGSLPASAPSAGSATDPPGSGGAAHRSRRLKLTKVALVGRRGAGRRQVLVFTLSARGRVQISLVRAAGARAAAGDAVRLALTARQGQNRFVLTALLRGRRVPPGRYVLTVRAGNGTATLRVTV
jgi:thermitase